MSYIDGFVAPVPKANQEAFVKHATNMASAFKAHGATGVFECWGDDVPDGKLTSLPLAVQLKPDETVVFSWITWPSRAVRDEAWKKIMEDPAMANGSAMPFDGKRAIFGGFQVLLQA